MTDITVWQITEDRNEAVSVKDASTLDAITRQLPEGYYSTFRTFDGGTRVLGLTSHLERLYKPITTPEVDEPFLRRELYALLDAYRPNEARVRAIMTTQGEIYVAIAPLMPLPRGTYAEGVRVETIELHREHPHLKSTSFIGRSDAERKYIAREGIFEALLVKEGKILEGMTSNFFYVEVQPGTSFYIGTAGNEILPGVTRETVLEITRGRGMGVKYKLLNKDQLAAVSEAFITSSSRAIVPVVRIDDITIGQGRPGPITKELMAAYEAYVVANAERIWR